MKLPLARAAIALLAAATLTAVVPVSASAMDIQRVRSPGGIEAWLVESHVVPLIAMRFAFMGGSSQDPAGKDGLSYFVSGMMDEGAAELGANAFQERMEELAVKMNFEAARDVMAASVQTLSERKDEAFELVSKAITKPRFDQDAVERIRGQIIAALRFDENDPEKVASEQWYKLAFPGHPYANPLKGSPEGIDAVMQADLKDYASRNFARDNLKIAVVGDIDAETLGKDLDRIFGGLPEKSDLTPVPEAEPPLGPKREIIQMDVPQSVAQFGQRGLKRKDEDFNAAYMLNYIIGGGGFSSRLMEEVREKRGLAYSVYSYLYPFQHGAVFVGAVATENQAVTTSLKVISDELERFATQGPTAEELANAKAYLTGAYALRFDTSNKIANQLLWLQIEDLGIDYIDKRNAMIEAVTLEDIKRVANKLIQADQLITTIVGNPLPSQQTPTAAPPTSPEAPPIKPEETAPTSPADAPATPG